MEHNKIIDEKFFICILVEF